jgi:hypothetical protein
MKMNKNINNLRFNKLISFCKNMKLLKNRIFSIKKFLNLQIINHNNHLLRKYNNKLIKHLVLEVTSKMKKQDKIIIIVIPINIV